MSRTVSHWLGPGQGRWAPSTWADLQRAAADGLLDETGWVELKEKVASGKPANLELARDLASLALRSGLLVVGVREHSRGNAGEVVGIELDGQRDRIDQVAQTRIDPPLSVDIQQIEDPDRPGIGCLLVSVPVTGPHMADGRYWGRGDTGKRVLPHAEVRDHLARRRVDEQTLLDQVRALEQSYLARRQWEEDLPAARVYLRAIPVDARRDCLLDLTGDDEGLPRIQELATQVARRRPNPERSMTLSRATSWTPHALGRSMSSLHPGEPPERARNLVEVVLEDHGPVSLTHAAAAVAHRDQWPADAPPKSALHVETALGAVTDVLGVAGGLGDTVAAYQGTWQVAVRVSDLTGCHDYTPLYRSSSFDAPLSFRGGSDYEEVVIATTAQLVTRPWTVTQHLLGRLVRALGADKRCLPYAPQPTA